jgi:hypothetical protein
MLKTLSDATTKFVSEVSCWGPFSALMLLLTIDMMTSAVL